MDDLYKDIYKTESTRLTNWNYSKPAYYFLTICTNKRKIFFGQVLNQKMILNDIGKNVEQIWHELPNHFPHILLDEFIIMPNHLHGIILIQSQEKNFDYFFNGNIPGTYNVHVHICRDKACLVSTNRWQNPGQGSISTIIGSFKSACTKNININFPGLYFSWQPRFYDHVIRDAESLISIKNYILNNPCNWPGDRNNPKNIK